MGAFKDTRNMFIDHIGYIRPLTYQEWLNAVPYEDKAAVLFVQFYDQITLAWAKTKSFFVLEEDGVSCVLDYLSRKNVDAIIEEEARFSPAYIYRVAFNCLYCISHDIQRDIDRWRFEMSNIVKYGDDELDLFDQVITEDTTHEESTREEFWRVVEGADATSKESKETMKVVYNILNGTGLRKNTLRESTKRDAEIAKDSKRVEEELAKYTTKDRRREAKQRIESNAIKYANYQADMLRDITVSAARAEEILAELRVKLEKFSDIYYNN